MRNGRASDPLNLCSTSGTSVVAKGSRLTLVSRSVNGHLSVSVCRDQILVRSPLAFPRE